MSSFPVALICLLAAFGEPRVDLALPDLSLVPPSGLELVGTEPPSLFEGVWREKTQQQARLVLFVLPIPALSGESDRLDAARRVSAAYTPLPLERVDPVDGALDGAGWLTLAGEQSGRAARVTIFQPGHRTLGLLLFGGRVAVEELIEPCSRTAASVSDSSAAHPSGLDVRLDHDAAGFSIRAPVGFVRSRNPDAPILAEAHLPYHFGISAQIAVTLVTSGLERSLDETGSEVKKRLGTESASGRPKQQELIRFVDLEHHRVRISCSAPADRFDRYRAAFESALDSFGKRRRRLTPALGPRYRDSESGFSIRPPSGFTRSGGFGDTLVTFVEQHTLPPANRLEIRLIRTGQTGADPDQCLRIGEALLLRGEERGLRRLRPLHSRLINGLRAAGFGLSAGDQPGDAAELHWLISTGRQLLELSFVTTRRELPIYEPLLRASVISFELVPESHAPALAPALNLANGRMSIRPPRDWARVESEAHLLSYLESPDAVGRARLDVGVDPLPTGEKRFASPADRYRRELLERLEREGHLGVRIESAESSTQNSQIHIRLRIAYSRQGKPVRELRHAILTGRDVVYARAVAPGSHFRSYQRLFQATTSSLRLAEE